LTAHQRFIGKKVLITGAAQGIGSAIASRFIEEGADVFLTDLNEEKVEQTTSALRAEYPGSQTVISAGCDVTDEESVGRAFQTAVDQLGGVDILANNAGVITMRKTEDLTVADWDLNMNVNAKGVFLCTREAIPIMIGRGGGVIVNTASQAGKSGYPLFSHYCASKAAVINFTKAVAMEYAPTIRANCVCPGIVNTDMMDREYVWENEMTGEPIDSIKARWMSGIPMGRFQEPHHIAALVAFLASEDASEMTGQAVNVTGGMVMH
jgi:meso-butanediol dehydrogenase / (S,S)-butanediol dehydrogenase / diacetyl reductase